MLVIRITGSGSSHAEPCPPTRPPAESQESPLFHITSGAWRRLVRWGCAAALALAVVPGSALANPAGTPHYPDLQTVIPTDSFSIAQGTAGPEFRYTHLVYNAGPGPLEIQPQYNGASGNYQGQQQIFTHDDAGHWSLVEQDRVADAFVFHAEHGHFHFPLASFGLYQVAADGGIGAPVAISPKIGFCIDDSYIYDSTVTHAGVFVGQRGSCADPTTLRGISVGGADEYDYRDPGQAIPFSGVPDGTYWFKAVTDPNNDIREANEANNETDVKVTIAAGKVTPGEVRHPDTTPPTIGLDAPADGASVSGNVTLTAHTPVTAGSGVQFLVDGNPVGVSTDTGNPYHLTWNSNTVVDGEHWIAARVTDAQGHTSTSSVAAVTVANAGSPTSGGSLGVDGTVSADGRGAVTTQGLSTVNSNDLVLAFVSADGPTAGGQTATVTGGGLSWALVRRANTRAGTSEIWQAKAPGALSNLAVTSTLAKANYDQSVSVVAFQNAAGTGASVAGGAANGAPHVALTTTAAGSWVFGVGNDWDAAKARTLGANQVLRHQWVDTAVGDTFWLQSQQDPTPASGTSVSIDATAPTTDQWNLAAVEVLSGSVMSPPPADLQPPIVSLSDPPDGATLTGIVQLGATASDNRGVTGVQFKVDGQPLGAPDTAPPFAMAWDTRTATQGTHTLTAEATDAAGNVGVSQTVTVKVDNSAAPPAVVSIDQSQFKHGRSTLQSPGVSTSAAGEQLLCFVAYDGPNAPTSQRSTVTGGGLNWTLVKRSDSQAGVSEIWSAKATSQLSNAVVTATPLRAGFDGLLDVIAFKNASGIGVAGATGATSGAPDIYLPGVQPGSWVFAVGNDWDRAVARTPVSGQVLQHQWIDTATGDTFWVQSTAAPTQALSLVTLHDDAPTNDRWNYTAAEVTAAPSG